MAARINGHPLWVDSAFAVVHQSLSECVSSPHVQGKLSVDAMFETLEAVPNISSIHARGVKPYDTLEFEVNGERLCNQD
jgi:hypothetical protein